MIALGVLGALLLSDWLLFLLLGPDPTAIWLVGTVQPALCAAAFVFCCDLRDGRLLFTLVTIGVDVSICDALASMLASRGDPRWLVYRMGITLVQALLLWRFARRPFLEMLDASQVNWGRITAIPLSFWICLVGGYLPSSVVEHTRLAPLPTLLLCVSIVLTYITLYHFQRALLEQAEARQNSAMLHSEVDFLRRQARQAQSAEENLRVFRHDMRHYIRMLSGCLDSGDLSSAREVLSLLEQNTDSLSGLNLTREYTGIPILDIVLTQAAEQAGRLGVGFEVQLTLPEDLRVDTTELAVFVSNALENALTAAAGEPEGAARQVSIRSLPCRQQLFLLISNTFSGALELDEKTGLPRTNRDGHGFGTRSLFNFAQKYGCLLNCSLRDGTFCLRLLL